VGYYTDVKNMNQGELLDTIHINHKLHECWLSKAIARLLPRVWYILINITRIILYSKYAY
jgi:hypothetical protein